MKQAALLLLCAAALVAQPPKMPTVLYGAAYYHEYMPYERLDKDVELMRQAGLSVVRVGESTWTSWEPREGQFEFSWMGRVLDRMHKAGIKVILGTPTYSIPPWLYRKHPEILVRRLDGSKATYGIRQNMDITHPVYRYYCERVNREIVNHFKDHPAVIGYQIDNETSSYNAAGPQVQANFVDYLKKKFGSVQRLNKIWGFVYWGQLVNDWDELPPRDGILNPGYKLEWERFQQARVTDFLSWQAKLVKEYKHPDQFITQDFSGGLHTDIDQWAIARSLDIVATNPYYPVQDELDFAAPTFTDDVARSLKGANFLVTETNAQTIGWNSKGQFPPYDGQLRMNVYGHLADGANMVEYWHWHSLHYGQETYWKGLLSHDLEPNRVYSEASRVAHELQEIGPRLVNLKKQNSVAIFYSIDSYHGIRFMPFADSTDYMTLVHQFHDALYRMNVGVDFVTPETTDLSRYKVLLVPPLYVASGETLTRLSEYARNGGHLLLTFKSGFTDEYDTVRSTVAPGPLREAAGFHYQEFSNLRKPLALKGDPYHAGAANQVSHWAEMIVPDTAKAIAYYDHPFFGRYPAITRNNFGKGSVTFEGTVLSDALQAKVLLDVLQEAGLTGPDQELPEKVRVKHGTGNSGKAIHYYFNYSGSGQSFAYAYAPGSDLLSGKSVDKSRQVTLGPWDVAIIEER
ncbi:MAG: beta-galactosidase [Acidobacteria bacterium]|nr:beta-galactosidase [Acidobacteriota bacterium]